VRHRTSPWMGLLVGHQWHRRYLARAMTALTVILQDGKDIAVKRWSRRSAAMLRWTVRRLPCREQERAASKCR
jgi:hypothetical protein